MRIKIRTLKDARGRILFPFENKAAKSALLDGSAKNIHVATLKPGAVRGNHRHPDHDEFILCVGEGGTFVVRQDGKKRKTKIGDSLIRIKRNLPHAIVNNGKNDIVLFCFYSAGSRKTLTRIPEKVA